MTTRELLEALTPSKEVVQRFLDVENPGHTVFDPELGYLLHDSVLADGVDGSHTLNRFEPSGARRRVNFADRQCRINTYGDSFTQCSQVSDGETWQEYLAAHLGEPLRNFGVRGYGAYQAYRRMLREEARDHGAPFLMLNIYGDDHLRSIYPWRWLHLKSVFAAALKGDRGGGLHRFHANPWVHLGVSPRTGEIEERRNAYTTPESLYRLCDPEYVYEVFGSAFDVQALCARQNITDVNEDLLRQMGELLQVSTDFSSPEATSRSGSALLWASGLRASQYVVEKAALFAAAQHKQLLILLSFSEEEVADALAGQLRPDRPFVDFLKEGGYRFVDALQAHIDDYRCFSCGIPKYLERYYISHYNPRGNHFFAFAVKDTVVDWLVPRPRTYRDVVGTPGPAPEG